MSKAFRFGSPDGRPRQEGRPAILRVKYRIGPRREGELDRMLGNTNTNGSRRPITLPTLEWQERWLKEE